MTSAECRQQCSALLRSLWSIVHRSINALLADAEPVSLPVVHWNRTLTAVIN